MATRIEKDAPRELAQADLKPRGTVHPSPADWRDQILYQLLPDRFSDGQEGDRETFDPIAAIARLRNRQDAIGITLRRGHLFPRETSLVGYPFAIHGPGELVAWSQLFFETEVLMALNPHGYEARGAEVTVDASLHPDDFTMTFLYKSDWSDAELGNPPQDQTLTVQHRGGRAVVRIDLPPSGMAILA